MNLTLVTDAGILDEPLLVADAGDYLRDVPAADLTTVQRLITAARLEAENENGRELAVKTWTLVLDRFPSGSGVLSTAFSNYGTQGNRNFEFGVDPRFIELLDPLISAGPITCKQADGSLVTLLENVDFVVDVMKHPGVICPAPGKTWPGGALWPSSAVQIPFTAGFLPAACPENIKQGMRLLVSEWYENRLPFAAIRFVAEMPFNVSNLFRNKKLWRF